MLKFENLKATELHTFHSEKIGVVFYYLCKMQVQGRNVWFCIHFDCDDLWERVDEDKDSWDDDDLNGLVIDYSQCVAEQICSTSRINKVLEQAIKTIREYRGADIPDVFEIA